MTFNVMCAAGRCLKQQAEAGPQALQLLSDRLMKQAG